MIGTGRGRSAKYQIPAAAPMTANAPPASQEVLDFRFDISGLRADLAAGLSVVFFVWTGRPEETRRLARERFRFDMKKECSAGLASEASAYFLMALRMFLASAERSVSGSSVKNFSNCWIAAAVSALLR